MMKRTLLFLAVMAITFTQAQVSLVKDLNPGISGGVTSAQGNRIEHNGKLLFSGGGINGEYELWETDGTESGTQLLKNIQSQTGKSSDLGRFYKDVPSNTVYFSASNYAYFYPTNFELWKTDGTTTGTVMVANIGTQGNTFGSSYPKYMTSYLGKIIFTAKFTNATGLELFSTDGTAANTVNIIDINTTTIEGDPGPYIELNNKLYFAVTDGGSAYGRELWETNGTTSGTTIVSDIWTGVGDSNPVYLTKFNNKIYFSANDGVNGRELWSTDGTTTQMVLDLNSAMASSNPENLTVFNNALYFTATHPTLGTEVFKMNTNENITNLKNIAPISGANSNPSNLFVFNGKLYFSADDNTNGIELWSSTGFSSTTNMVKNINTSAATPDSNPSGFTEYNNKLYFAANNDTNGRELWITDGTTNGTLLVEDINNSGDSNPTDIIVANDLLFFSADNGATGRELFKYKDPTLSIKNVELNKSISIFPNPTKNSFSIDTKFDIETVEILDVSGKQLKLFKNNIDSYNIQNLVAGIYFARIITEKGSVTKKLIKE